MSESITTKVSSYRWIVLILFMFMGMMTQILWLTFAPITIDVSLIYTGGSADLVLLLSLVFMIVYLPVTFPASWCIDKLGLKWGTGIGVIITGVFGFLRAFAINFPMLIVFQIGCAAGQPFVLNSFTKVSANWFPESEKTLATGLGTMSMFVGLIIANFLTPVLILPFKIAGLLSLGVTTILFIYGIMSLVFMGLYIAFVKDKPETPPSPHAAEEKTLMLQGIKDLFKNRDFILLFFLILIGLGAFNAILSYVDLIFGILRPIDIMTPINSGLIGGMMIVGGICGSIILSALSDKYQKRRIFLIIATGSAIPLTLLLAWLPFLIPLIIIAFVFGFLLVSALPIGLTYATEKTHPVPEGTSNGLLMFIGQIGGIVLMLAFDMTIIAIIFGIGLVLTLFMREIEPTSK
ncbi:MAG: MFS transporter [Candidatus Helarchaeota archaeon]